MSKFPIYQIPGAKDNIGQRNITGVVPKRWIDEPILGRCLVKLGDELWLFSTKYARSIVILVKEHSKK